MGIPPGLPTEREILGRAAGENFTVASRLLPAGARLHLLNFYGFARLVDQLGDAYPGDRLTALGWLETEVRRALVDPGAPGVHPLVARAVSSVSGLGLTVDPLLHLIEANRQDQTVSRYPTFEDLVGYCRLSADPVGRLVLGAFGVSEGPQLGWSDSICTGLQLVEHWQDVTEDARAGRIYLPGEDLERFGVDEADLVSVSAPGPGLRALMAFEVARARRWLDGGLPLLSSLRGRARWAVTGFWAGGHSALDAIVRDRYDVFSARPRPRRLTVAATTLAASGRLSLGGSAR